MRVIVLGAGMMGQAVVKDLAASPGVSRVMVADRDLSLALAARNRWERGPVEIEAVQLDLSDGEQVVHLMRGHDVVAGAYPERWAPEVTRYAVRAGTSLVDMTALHDWEGRATMHDEAVRAGITIVPGCGVAPGLSNILMGVGTEMVRDPRKGMILVGGLPQEPRPPLGYSVVFSFETVIDEYTVPPRVVRDGAVEVLEPLSGLEQVEFPHPVGVCECFYTDGLTTLLDTMPRRGLALVEEKTVRYPGHRDAVKVLLDCGFLSDTPVRTGDAAIVPRQFTTDLLTPRLKGDLDRDLTCMKVVVSGDQTVAFELLDFYDEETGVTSMARTTGYTCSIVTQMVARGQVAGRGFLPPEDAVPRALYPLLEEELARRGILISKRIS